MNPSEGSPVPASPAVLNKDDFPGSNFTNTKFTDLIIYCQGKKFHVHKFVLAQHSAFFNKACDPDSPWIEARTGEIHLDDNDPEIVQAMLRYCYSGKEFLKETGYVGDGTPDELLRFYILLRELGDQYQVVGLEQAAFDRFSEVLYCMLTDDPPEISPACMAKVARDIFQTTRETELNFRRAVLGKISLNIVTLRRSSRFNREIAKIDGFWEHLVDFDAEFGYRARHCPSCGEVDFLDARRCYKSPISCDACHTSHSLDAWNKGNEEDDMAPDTDTEEESTPEEPSKKRQRVD